VSFPLTVQRKDMLSPEFHDFCHSWLNKADEYTTNTLQECFDKFFTLFVVYNRLYGETTFVLHRKNIINISRRTAFPDADAAKNYVLQYLGSYSFIDSLANNQATSNAIISLKQLLAGGHFFIKLHMITGKRQRNKDLELLEQLNSKNKNTKAHAILDVLYSVRCNMFHGHKGFDEFQTALLSPCIILLESICRQLLNKLENEI
jgi:hypothetical protein